MNEPYTVLLVEDDPTDVLLVERAFRKAGLPVPPHVVRDGDEAVAYLAGDGAYADREKHPLPALILLDLKLPRRSGLEVLAWLRSQPGLKRMPVVVLTSSRRSDDIDGAYDLGANSYVVKSLDLDGQAEMARTLNHYWLNFNERPRAETA